MKKILMISILVLTACSSPPEPPQVEWEKMPEVMNTQIMNWTPIEYQPLNRWLNNDYVEIYLSRINVQRLP